MKNWQKEKSEKFRESVSKEGTVRPKQLSAWEKMKEEWEKKEIEEKALKLKQERDAKEKAEEITKSKSIINFVCKKIQSYSDNIWNVFNTFDTDKSGSIDKVELKRVLDYCQVTLNEADLDKVFDMIDQDGNKKISY